MEPSSPKSSSRKASRKSSVKDADSASEESYGLPTFLWIPNLIGYTRVLLLFAAAYLSGSAAYASMICYMVSMLLDAVDGMAARHFNQTSHFGAVLDMVSDRITTMVLTCILGGRLLPEYLMVFIGLVALDISSHWVLMQKALVLGATSHKSVDGQKNVLMRIYYTVPYAMFVVCFFSEAFYVSLFMWTARPDDWHFVPWGGAHVSLFQASFYFATPFFVFKQIVNVIQMVEAFADLGRHDYKVRAQKMQAGKNQ